MKESTISVESSSVFTSIVISHTQIPASFHENQEIAGQLYHHSSSIPHLVFVSGSHMADVMGTEIDSVLELNVRELVIQAVSPS